jgi:hypothetical protein
LEKLDKGFAVGAIVAAFALGGLLYIVYPNGFSGFSSTYSAASTSDTGQLYTGPVEQTAIAGASNTTANQNSTQGNATSGAQTTTNSSGY